MAHIELREIDDEDLDAVFEMMRDSDAVAMASFTAADPSDRGAFDAHMARVRADPDNVLRIVTERGGFAGTVGAYTEDREREVTYWIARHAWGRGVATAALDLLVSHEPERPLFARVAAHNAGSIAVLEKNGFAEVSRSMQFAAGLGRQVEELRFALLPVIE